MWRSLERHQPGGDSRNVDLRGWEWFYLRNQCGGEELRLLGAHSNAIVAVRYSTNGRRVFSADQLGLVRIWNADGGGLQEEFRVDGGHHFENSPDGRWFAVGVNERIDLLDAATHQRVRSLTSTSQSRERRSVLTLAFWPWPRTAKWCVGTWPELWS